jgi:hypothetical protein
MLFYALQPHSIAAALKLGSKKLLAADIKFTMMMMDDA